MARKWTTIGALVMAAACFATVAHAVDDVKKLSAVDLGVETHKWEGKKIEVQLRCFYADKDEYRCIGSNARVDLAKISNPEGKSHVEDKCDTLQKTALNAACMVTVRFTYSGFRKEETNNGSKILMIEAEDDTGEVIPPSARKRR